MSTTQGDISHMYCTEGGNPKSVTVLCEVICSPDVKSSKEDREAFCKILDNEIEELEKTNE